MEEVVDILYNILKDVESAEENGLDCMELEYYETILDDTKKNEIILNNIKNSAI